MRTFLLLAVLLAAGFALAAGGITLDGTTRVELTDCASGGSSSTTLAADTQYLFRVTDADTTLCLAATCATGGDLFPVGTVLLFQTAAGGPSKVATTISCRSASSTGDVRFARAVGP